MKSRLLGYDENQVRVYIADLQASNQRQNDQWQAMISALQIQIDQTTSNLEQLEIELGICLARSAQLQQVWGRALEVKRRLLDQAQTNANLIIAEAKGQTSEQTCEELKVNGEIFSSQQMFSDLIYSCIAKWDDLLAQGE